MRLSRVVLTKGNQEAILQGMRHAGPRPAYEKLQRDLDRAAADGYVIFYEGMDAEVDEPPRTPNEAKIRKFFDLVFSLDMSSPGDLGYTSQLYDINYPEDAINADMTNGEFMRRLDERGFTCDLLLSAVETVNKQNVQRKVRAYLEEADRESVNLNDSRSLIGKAVTWLMFRKVDAVALDERNALVVAMIRERANGRNVYVHYGNQHLKGMVALMKRDGWKVKTFTEVDWS
jgi:hypothetical protein